MMNPASEIMGESYPDFFHRITNHEILPYQERYGRDPFSPALLEIPTGLGKSDAVLLPWLYAKAHDKPAPTRLILVLPRRNLTAQTAENALERCRAARLDDRITILELMAASDDNREKLRPDEDAIIVATQDLYFSRALNRGYARRPPRWPIDFALFNQDCLIVLDEIQLMDDALATSTQLAAFRAEFGVFAPAPTVWMSATVNHEWLRTVDAPHLPPVIRLTEDDLQNELVRRRIHAPKPVARAPEECRDPAGCADFALSRHKPGTRTLIVANTVPRARQIFGFLKASFPGAILIHSRFRPADRAAAAKRLGEKPPEGQIVVSTQVLEAGVDISGKLLVTDVAPWGSLVQRFGRVNRYGDDESAEIWWVDQPAYAKQKDPTAPYSASEIQRALEHLANLTSGSPATLAKEDGPEPWQHVLRRADLLDLFDTTPDLSGNDLDVSRFIRATQDNDVYLAWREWSGEGAPPEAGTKLVDAELCPVPIGDLRDFAKKHTVYAWNFAVEEWVEADGAQIYPGMLAITRCQEGGYTAEEGWSPESKKRVESVAPSGDDEEGDSSDTASFQTYRQILKDHTDRVIEELKVLLSAVELDTESSMALLRSAELHDWGKAHPVFQETMYRPEPAAPDLLAKRCGRANHSKKHFRHELASALAMLQTGESALAAYLAAAHHGRIRMGIRSMPGEKEEGGKPIARGIVEGDELREGEIASGIFRPPVALSLAPMTFGAKGGSWTERMLRVRDRLGPFRLAYLETLLRAADERASEDPRLKEATCTD